MKLKSKKGTILAENIIFIVLNLVFLTILILFLFSKTSSSSVIEERYAKQIALIIDAARPVMEIHFNMEDAFKKAKDNGFLVSSIVSINDNVITVRLSEDSRGHSYSFFNSVDVNAYPSNNGKDYVLTINNKT